MSEVVGLEDEAELSHKPLLLGIGGCDEVVIDEGRHVIEASPSIFHDFRILIKKINIYF
jgi:hypothetical protein